MGAPLGRQTGPADPDYPVDRRSKLPPRGLGEMASGRTGFELRERQVQHHCGHRDRLVFVACQQRCVLRQLSGIDLAGSDTAKYVVGVSELVAFAVLAARQLDAGPYSVLLPLRDGVCGTAALLRQRAATQALDARLGG